MSIVIGFSESDVCAGDRTPGSPDSASAAWALSPGKVKEVESDVWLVGPASAVRGLVVTRETFLSPRLWSLRTIVLRGMGNNICANVARLWNRLEGEVKSGVADTT